MKTGGPPSDIYRDQHEWALYIQGGSGFTVWVHYAILRMFTYHNLTVCVYWEALSVCGLAQATLGNTECL